MVNIPANVGTFTVTVNDTNSNGDNITMIAVYDHPFEYTNTVTYDVYASAPQSASLVVNAPHTGSLYVQISGKNLDYATTSYTFCTPPNVGPKCAGILHNSSDLGPFTRPAGSYDYWAVPAHVANTTFSFNVTVTSNVNGQTWVYIQADAYPNLDNLGLVEQETLAYGVSPRVPSFLELVLFPQDFIANSTWYIGIYTPGGHTFSVSMGTRPFVVPVQGFLTSGSGSSSSSSAVTNSFGVSLALFLLFVVLYG